MLVNLKIKVYVNFLFVTLFIHEFYLYYKFEHSFLHLLLPNKNVHVLLPSISSFILFNTLNLPKVFIK
jgi:hypothetical protein